MQVAQMQFANELLYVVDYTVLRKNEQGYVVQIEVVNAMQKATDLFSRVTADLSQASRKLVLQTDAHGQLLHVENQPEILRAWEALYPALQAKYSADPTIKPYLEAFGEQLAVPGSMEDNLRDKGVCGALLLAVYGQVYHQGTPLLTKRQIRGFFHEFDLPLQLATTAISVPELLPAPTTVLLNATARVDDEAFAEADFRRLMRSIVDDYTFPVALQLEYTAQHALAANTGHLLRSQQRLAAEVPGIYQNTVTHEVFPQPVA
ncbi:MAG: hypothetical protein EOO62_12650 [Hymenobacter sp.]|nr:MAG: hypothetical protein EOO62_12650 [Hymenobacter sp.]